VLDAYPDRPYRAQLRQIVPTADRQKGAVKVKVALLERDDKVLPEMSARVSFLGEDVLRSQAQPLITVPASAVVSVDGRDGVLVLDGENAAFRPLDLGRTNGTSREVRFGVEPGTRIVADARLDARGWRSLNRVAPKDD
jgi:multidrug efflux pump subunit AcrA (membrane-fusion protein)